MGPEFEVLGERLLAREARTFPHWGVPDLLVRPAGGEGRCVLVDVTGPPGIHLLLAARLTLHAKRNLMRRLGMVGEEVGLVLVSVSDASPAIVGLMTADGTRIIEAAGRERMEDVLALAAGAVLAELGARLLDLSDEDLF